VRELGAILAGISVSLIWISLWGALLCALGLPSLRRKPTNIANRREATRRLGRLSYLILFGVLGWGLAFGLAMITADYVRGDPHALARELSKLAFLSIVAGLFSGVSSWSRYHPVPFPPDYPPQK
jgi:hypothetical protein